MTSDVNIFKIETNYRSSPEILDLANGILQSRAVETSYSKELKASRPHQDLPVVVHHVPTYIHTGTYIHTYLQRSHVAESEGTPGTSGGRVPCEVVGGELLAHGRLELRVEHVLDVPHCVLVSGHNVPHLPRQQPGGPVVPPAVAAALSGLLAVLRC